MLKLDSLYNQNKSYKIFIYLLFYVFIKCIFILYQLHSITTNIEIISANFQQQHIVGISPYFDVTDMIVLPVTISALIFTGFFRDLYSWRSIFLSLGVLSLILLILNFNTLIISFLIAPLSLSLFSVTLSSAIKSKDSKAASIAVIFIFYSVFIFLFPQLWQFFFSKKLLSLALLTNFSQYFYIGCYIVLAIFIIILMYGIHRSSNNRKIKNNSVRFLIASIGFPLKNINLKMTIKLIILFGFMQFARYLRISLVEDQVEAFDISLLKLVMLQAFFIVVCAYIGYKSIQKSDVWYRYVCIGYIAFIISLTIFYTMSDYNAITAQILFYIISSSTLGMMVLCGATFIARGLDLSNRYVGFQVGVFLAVIMICWRIAFFVENFVYSLLGIFI